MGSPVLPAHSYHARDSLQTLQTESITGTLTTVASVTLACRLVEKTRNCEREWMAQPARTEIGGIEGHLAECGSLDDDQGPVTQGPYSLRDVMLLPKAAESGVRRAGDYTTFPRQTFTSSSSESGGFTWNPVTNWEKTS